MKHLIAAAMIAASPAYAQEPQCAGTPDVYAALTNDAGESRIFSGSIEDMSGVVEIWGNHETETWTAIVTLPSGVSCLLGFGTGYQTMPEGDDL